MKEETIFHITDILGTFQFGTMKKEGIIPKISFFSDIGKFGSNMPKLIRKVDSYWFGMLMDKILRRCINDKKYESRFLIEGYYDTVKVTRVKQCELIDVQNEDLYFNDVCSNILSIMNLGKEKVIVHEPEWLFRNIVGHPDLIIDDVIYDIKATCNFSYIKIHTVFQLLGYYALSKKLNKNMNKIGVILPCQGIVKVIDLSKWNPDNYFDKLYQSSIDKSALKSVDVPSLMEFEEIKEYIGTHVSKKSTLFQTLNTLTKKYKPIQLFFGTRLNFKTSFTSSDITKSREFIKKNSMNVFVHAPYINISRSDTYITEGLSNQLNILKSVGGKGVVVHIGKQSTMEYEEAYFNMYNCINEVSKDASKDCNILIETDSGHSILDDPIDLINFIGTIDKSSRKNISVCLDTCHVFACGYDCMETLKLFEKNKIRVGLIHFNDSKFKFGCKKDRHESIGNGQIGMTMLINVAKYAYYHNIPLVVE